MPPRPQPKIHQILLKTHKLTIALSGVKPSATISQLKKEALEALKAEVSEDLLLSISPSLSSPLLLESHNDFELCRQDREKGRPTGTYSVLDPGRQVREHGLAAWETLFIQFRNPETRAPFPVTVTLPSIDDDEPAMETAPRPMPLDEVKGKRKVDANDEDSRKGKRKADFSDEEI